jgi:PhzF family phenazine biosynthesis protein
MQLLQVDAFTDRPFAGNPAGVCLLDGPAPERWMQDLASEINLAETAFLYPDGDRWALRWFTPTVEVPLCGHATLASAHALLESGHTGELRFATLSGVLTARQSDDGIVLDLPANPPVPTEPRAGLLEALGVRGEVLLAANDWWLVVVDSAEQVRACTPSMTALGPVSGHAIVTAPADTEGTDVVSRVFAPGVGIDEDPVTGAAHCVLAPYWATRLGRPRVRAHQASRRGGDLTMEAVGDRVLLTGTAVTVATFALTDAALPR